MLATDKTYTDQRLSSGSSRRKDGSQEMGSNSARSPYGFKPVKADAADMSPYRAGTRKPAGQKAQPHQLGSEKKKAEN
jgi:hypothetical protein